MDTAKIIAETWKTANECNLKESGWKLSWQKRVYHCASYRKSTGCRSLPQRRGWIDGLMPRSSAWKLLLKWNECGTVEEEDEQRNVAGKLRPFLHVTLKSFGCSQAQTCREIFETDDFNFERSSKILVSIKSVYACCREICHKKKILPSKLHW